MRQILSLPKQQMSLVTFQWERQTSKVAYMVMSATEKDKGGGMQIYRVATMGLTTSP